MRQIVIEPCSIDETDSPYIMQFIQRYYEQRESFIYITKSKLNGFCGIEKDIVFSKLCEVVPSQRQQGYIFQFHEEDGSVSVTDIMNIINRWVRSGILPHLIISDIASVCGVYAASVIRLLRNYVYGDVIVTLEGFEQITNLTELSQFVKELNHHYSFVVLSQKQLGGEKCC